jgi:hypothetical protein
MELRPIDRTDRGRSRLAAALQIYRETILPEAQNPERQILYWIDHSRESLSDEFRCFAIQDKATVVGYFQYSYFQEEHIFFFEYLCVRSSNRRGLVPSEAVKAIAEFLAENYRPGFTIVFEVAKTRTASGDWQSDKKLIAYFTRLGFRKVDFSYHYPVLQSYEGGLSYPADLMVRLPAERIAVTSFEVRTMLRCIYFKHYLRWDRPFLDAEDLAKRELLINELYSKEVVRLSSDATLGTTGDDRRRGFLAWLGYPQPRIGVLLTRVFGAKMPRILVIMALLLVAQWFLGSGVLLVPFVLAVAVIYCLAENTRDSKKLLAAMISRLGAWKPR